MTNWAAIIAGVMSAAIRSVCFALAGWIVYDRILHWYGYTPASAFAVTALLAMAWVNK